ncbi:hypothetical protein EVAR_96565_1 [Eumeta japonica]|uniref:Uncharacterized protein n=1 Tax=Eumeta variegata TaxID=151549 RepID=A0A4C1WUS0_EUMVA|nr:hypothetical protein EVAR_96565_1 [Eumeta japonica]
MSKIEFIDVRFIYLARSIAVQRRCRWLRRRRPLCAGDAPPGCECATGYKCAESTGVFDRHIIQLKKNWYKKTVYNVERLEPSATLNVRPAGLAGCVKRTDNTSASPGVEGNQWRVVITYSLIAVGALIGRVVCTSSFPRCGAATTRQLFKSCQYDISTVGSIALAHRWLSLTAVECSGGYLILERAQCCPRRARVRRQSRRIKAAVVVVAGLLHSATGAGAGVSLWLGPGHLLKRDTALLGHSLW